MYPKISKMNASLMDLLFTNARRNVTINNRWRIMNGTSILLIAIIIIGLIAIFYAISYNQIVIYKTKIEKAEGDIDEALRKKYDAIARLNVLIKKVVTKKDYLKEYIDLKEKRISNYELDRKLTEAVNTINEVKNDYSELDTKEFNKELKTINLLNEELTSSKNYYNKNTSELNTLIRKFPTNIVAKIHRYAIKPFFDGKNMQDAVTDDFKL